MDKITALKILNLDTKASFEDAKKAYRILAKKYHPDVVVKNSSIEKDAESKMKDINLAFRYLAPHLRSNKHPGKTKESQKKQSHKEPPKHPNDFKNTSKKKSVKQESDVKHSMSSMNSLSKKIMESFTNIFLKKTTATKPFKNKFKKDQVVRNQTNKVFFEDVFKQVHKGSLLNTETKRKKKKKTGLLNKKNSSDYYQKYMILKRKMKSVQSRTDQNMTIQRVEKIDPIRPVSPITKKK